MEYTDNEFVDKYQNALSDLCGVDYAYMQGDPAADTIVELIRLAVEQKAEIERLKRVVSHLEDYANGVADQVRAEAQKEFVERLKEKTGKAVELIHICVDRKYQSLADIIDNLVKEMEEDK